MVVVAVVIVVVIVVVVAETPLALNAASDPATPLLTTLISNYTPRWTVSENDRFYYSFRLMYCLLSF